MSTDVSEERTASIFRVTSKQSGTNYKTSGNLLVAGFLLGLLVTMKK
jgi:hypothetical protein